MAIRRDLTDERFGRLVVARAAGRSIDGRLLWRCECDCGNSSVVPTNNLASGNTKSCGCGKLRNLAGTRFERLVALRPAGRNPTGRVLWRCRCDCGARPIISAKHLTQGTTKSCGCLGRPAAFNHTRALDLWSLGMRANEIGREVGGRAGTVTAVVRRARAKGDERAQRRYLTFLPLVRELVR